MGWIREWFRVEMRAAMQPELDAVKEAVKEAAQRESKEQRVAVEACLREMAGALEVMRGQLEVDRAADREHLQHMLEDLVRRLQAAIGDAALPAPTIVGGTIPAPGGAVAGRPVEIDLTDPFPRGTRVEARSRFSETWFEGLEVTEVVPDPSGSRYRLVRRSDSRALPMLYGVDEIRPSPDRAGSVPSGNRLDTGD